MALKYRYTVRRRVENAIVATLVRFGVGLPPEFCLLTVRGRRSGKELTNPVLAISQDGHRWLVAPYGEVEWVLNARSNPRARLSRSRWSEDVLLSELEPKDAIPTLRAYIAKAPIVRPYFDVTPSSSERRIPRRSAEAPRVCDLSSLSRIQPTLRDEAGSLGAHRATLPLPVHRPRTLAIFHATSGPRTISPASLEM